MNGYNNLPEELRWELEGLFEGRAGTLCEAFICCALARYPGSGVRVTKTQASLSDGCIYAVLSPLTRWKAKYPDPALLLTLCLPAREDSARIAEAVEPYPGRWTHHIVLSAPEEIDEELLSWLETAHAFAQLRRRKPSRKGER